LATGDHRGIDAEESVLEQSAGMSAAGMEIALR
jgi:hypothetical protein